MQPVDNFYVLASCDSAMLSGVSQDQVDFGSLPEWVIKSPMLTVWRRLTVEVDSMGAGPPSGDFEESGTSTGLSTVALQDTSKNWTTNQFLNNQLMPDVSTDVSINITGNNANTLTTADDLTIDGAVVGAQYRIDDGDDFFNGDVPQPDCSLFANGFLPAYIHVTIINDEGSLTWKQYADPEDTDSRSFTRDELFWTVYVIGAYEGANQDMDNDPDTEYTTLGLTTFSLFNAPIASALYFESIRDWYSEKTKQGRATLDTLSWLCQNTILHEAGHQFGLHHYDDVNNGHTTGVMSDVNTDTDTTDNDNDGVVDEPREYPPGYPNDLHINRPNTFSTVSLRNIRERVNP